MVTPISFEVPAGFLSGESLRNWLRTDGAGIFTAFESGAAALRFIREFGVGIREQDFYAIRREVLSAIETSQPLANYPTNQLIPLNWHTTDHGLTLSDPFSYRVHVFGVDRETGAFNDQWHWIRSDRQLTIDEARNVVYDRLGTGTDSDSLENIYFGETEAMAWTI